MDREQLMALRGRVLNDIIPLTLNSEDAATRFGLLIRIIQSGGASGEIYNRAYESAKQIQDKDEQLDALVALLDELDFDASQEAVGQQAAPSTTPEPAQQPNTGQ